MNLGYAAIACAVAAFGIYLWRGERSRWKAIVAAQSEYIVELEDEVADLEDELDQLDEELRAMRMANASWRRFADHYLEN